MAARRSAGSRLSRSQTGQLSILLAAVNGCYSRLESLLARIE